jgi:bifunctional DNA-binding transcriptional regulator/antitoxin component of YhaV-PrlF toxin-antitoxin module
LVKLQKRFAYRYKGREGTKTHYKYVITIPEEVVEELDWKEGTELEQKVQDRKLVVEPTLQQKKEK